MIIVHQMAKVASLSWVEALQSAAPAFAAPMHSHFIVKRNLDRLAEVLAMSGECQTISNRLIPRDILRKGRAAAGAIAGTRAEGGAVRLICGIRDPVARSLSLYSFLTDFCGHNRRTLTGRDAGASVQAALETLRCAWESVYSGDEPDHSFEWLLCRMVGLFRTWFTEELLEPLGVDVRSSHIPERGGALRVRRGNVDVLVYRVEDMSPDAPAYDSLRAAAADFVEMPLPEWPMINRAESRQRSQQFNENVLREFRLPAPLLDIIYGEPIVSHFYRAEEIAAFRAHWS
jgi:hypothetical protein